MATLFKYGRPQFSTKRNLNLGGKTRYELWLSEPKEHNNKFISIMLSKLGKIVALSILERDIQMFAINFLDFKSLDNCIMDWEVTSQQTSLRHSSTSVAICMKSQVES